MAILAILSFRGYDKSLEVLNLPSLVPDKISDIDAENYPILMYSEI
jgi:hypothetical protein